jgi:hypothetical protein
MTQIFSLATPVYILQVSDRLVSTKLLGQPLSDHDPRFNKHILFVARDAVVAIGFTGLAYLDGVPVDQWIASVLTSEPPSAPQGGDGRGFRVATFGRRIFPSDWPDIGTAMKRIQGRVSSAAPRLRKEERESGLCLSLAGWQGRWRWSRDEGRFERIRPVLYRIWPDPARGFLLEGLPRYWGWESGQFRLDVVPKVPSEILDALRTELTSPPNGILTDDVARRILLEAMRRLAQLPERGVGNDYLSCAINLQREPMVTIQYHPQSLGSEFYTGWLVIPSFVQPPQVIRVSPDIKTSVQAGFLSISFEGPPLPPSGGFHASTTAQPRRPPP